jgi:hypothetical protein
MALHESAAALPFAYGTDAASSTTASSTSSATSTAASTAATSAAATVAAALETVAAYKRKVAAVRATQVSTDTYFTNLLL